MIAALTVSLVILSIESSVEAQGGLQKGFYSSTCPSAEQIVRSTVEKYFNRDSTIAAGLLRLHFHDCFVQVCLLGFSFIFFFFGVILTLIIKSILLTKTCFFYLTLEPSLLCTYGLIFWVLLVLLFLEFTTVFK
ncbi:hypothetical protein B296_00035666 [Ensete ventricosum]|uniref:Plant heme peroxidase family profile domain-containing protein n=1 Tax=Ensete ventricosum TaxID=4639 RepID=A0A426X273_ENSVE|nr:hypothetical protein B296_00035666 [Ensete ventricosum]